MTTESPQPPADDDRKNARRDLSPAAIRALEEAAARKAAAPEGPAERGGRGGLDPVRYGDWEIRGLTSDF